MKRCEFPHKENEEAECNDGGGVRKLKRSATQGVDYNEAAGPKLEQKRIRVTEIPSCKTEQAALKGTGSSECSAADGNTKRRLLAFSLLNKNNETVPLQRLGLNGESSLYVQGTIFPADGGMQRAAARTVDKPFGPLLGWSVRYDTEDPEIHVRTKRATYICMKPAPEYRREFDDVMEQARLCHALVQAVKAKDGSALSFDAVLAALSRAKIVKSYSSTREAVLLNASFITAQLPAMSAACASFEESVFFQQLPAQVARGQERMHERLGGSEAKLDICKEDGGQQDAPKEEAPAVKNDAEAADEDFARRLQAKLDAMGNQAPASGRGAAQKGAAIELVSEEEIADDYPLPAQYGMPEDEADELLVNGDDELAVNVDPNDLPRMVIEDFAAYNGEAFMSTLELLPMYVWQKEEADVDLFGSGTIREAHPHDSEWLAGHSLHVAGVHAEAAEADKDATGCSGGGAAAADKNAAGAAAGVRVYLSQIKEWMIEYGCDMCFILIRTQCAWYKIASVAECYMPWFRPVLKLARLAVHLLGLVQQAKRSSRVSVAEVVKQLAQQPPSAHTFISSKPEQVQRYLIAHGQVLLNQFQSHPSRQMQTCAFAAKLRELIAARRHCKLFLSRRKITAAAPSRRTNPMRDRVPVARPKPMAATATNLVKVVWTDYFKHAKGVGPPASAPAEAAASEDEEEDAEGGAGGAPAGGLVAEVENALTETAIAPVSVPKKQQRKQAKKASCAPQLLHKLDLPAEKCRAPGYTMFQSAKVGRVEFAVGDVVELAQEEEGRDLPFWGLVQAVFHSGDAADADLQVRVMQHGKETMLGDAAGEYELFVTQQTFECPITDVLAKTDAKRMQIAFGPMALRDAGWQQLQALAASNQAAEAEGRSVQLFYRTLYVPEEGMFRCLPEDLELGCFLPEREECDGVLDATLKAFSVAGCRYRVGDFVYLTPEAVLREGGRGGRGRREGESEEEGEEEAEEDAPTAGNGSGDEQPRWMLKYQEHDLKSGKGDLDGLQTYTVAQICSWTTTSLPSGGKEVAELDVRCFGRPEDVSAGLATRSDPWTVYATTGKQCSVSPDQLRGRCLVVLDKQLQTGPAEVTRQPLDVFVCAGSLRDGNVTDAPKSLGVKNGARQPLARPAAPRDAPPRKGSDGVALRTLDIFSGCGGLSEGLHQAGAAVTRWAVEYWKPAADAFKLNNPDAAVYNGNCNVLLHRAMQKAGMEEQCCASEECRKESSELDAATVDSLPLPGDVEFVCGGPPCQGYSGMNRFNQGAWSMVQNSMVMAYLSYADFYRPRYWLLENVRNFVSHNKSFTFRLTVRTLLEIGYQVRFGVLNAGNFGVSQSRKRTFIWAAAPGECLPAWPTPITVFKCPQLCINLPGGVSYRAIKDHRHARIRAVTVRDAISDLPAITNGSYTLEQPYGSEPTSSFQAGIRGGEAVLRDHVCKTMNALNLRRCSLVPKNTPGADWRQLVLHVREHPEDETFEGQKLVPWCLPNTAERHNGWRGLYGRLHWDGHFPTSVTDPNPMGKVGQVFHPEQDRIVSVRECARAQGFPDGFQFSGTVHDRHKEVGNAVPPPLAAALGRMLRQELDAKHARQSEELLKLQFQ